VRLGGTRMRYTGLMDKVYYKELYFDLLYPVWLKKFILFIDRPVVTWVQSFKINPGVHWLEPHLYKTT